MTNRLTINGTVESIESTRTGRTFYVNIRTMRNDFTVRAFCINQALKDVLRPGMKGRFSGSISTKYTKRTSLYQNSFVMDSFTESDSITPVNRFEITGILRSVQAKGNNDRNMRSCIRLKLTEPKCPETSVVSLVCWNKDVSDDLIEMLGKEVRLTGYETTGVNGNRPDNTHCITGASTVLHATND